MTYDKTEMSECCKANALEDYRPGLLDHHDLIEIYRCSKCKQECDLTEVCSICHDSGEAEIGEYDNIRTVRCPLCSLQRSTEDEMDDDS